MAALIKASRLNRFEKQMRDELSDPASECSAYIEMCEIFKLRNLSQTHWLMVSADLGVPTMITCPDVTDNGDIKNGYVSAIHSIWVSIVAGSNFMSNNSDDIEARLYTKLRDECIPISMGVSFGLFNKEPQFFFIFGPTDQSGENHIVLLSHSGRLHVTGMSVVIARSFDCFTAYNNDEEIPGLGPRLLQTPLFKN